VSRIRPVVTVVLALVALSAGCVGDDEEATPASVADDAAARPGGAAGTAGAAAQSAAAEGAADARAESRAPVESPFAHDGAIANRVSVCEFAVTQRCQGVTGAESAATFDLVWSGALEGFALEMAWTATSPATERLAAHLFTCAQGADGSVQCDMLAAAEGTSPLLLESRGLALAEGAQVSGYVYRPSELPQSPVPVFVL
jgi:hypothetical protein